MKSYKAKTFTLLLFLSVILITGCDPAKKWEKQEKQQIESYLGSIGDTVYTLKPSGLYYLDLVVGTGAAPVKLDTVVIKYKVTFLSGELLGTNYNDSTTFKWDVGNVYILPGLDEGVTYMKMGGKAKLLLPSSLAYGTYGQPPKVPGYTPLLFTVELVKVTPHKK